MHLKDRILISIGRRKDKAFLRQEFNGFGPRNSVDKAVRALVKDGRLVRLGYGVYAPAIDGQLAVDQVEAVMQALTKLDAKPKYGGRAWREWMAGRTLQVPMRETITVRKPVTRRLGLGNGKFEYEYA